jgi:hypothetical protein
MLPSPFAPPPPSKPTLTAFSPPSPPPPIYNSAGRVRRVMSAATTAGAGLATQREGPVRSAPVPPLLPLVPPPPSLPLVALGGALQWVTLCACALGPRRMAAWEGVRRGGWGE